MCYLVHQDAVPAEHGAGAPAPESGRIRSRWAGAAAATLVGGFALAALVAPSPTAPLAPPQHVAAAPTATRAAVLPAGVTLEKTALPTDDGVPTTSDVSRAAIGDCHHGL